MTSIEDDNPVMFIEHKAMYAMKGDVDDVVAPIPLGKADIKREGSDVTIVTYGKMVHEALAAAKTLEKEGIEAEVLDIRSLYPLDEKAIFDSIEKTNKVVIVSEEVKRGNYGGEMAAIIAEKAFDSLDAPIVRIGALNCPIPFASNLENYVLPNSVDIVNGVRSIAGSAVSAK